MTGVQTCALPIYQSKLKNMSPASRPGTQRDGLSALGKRLGNLGDVGRAQPEFLQQGRRGAGVAEHVGGADALDGGGERLAVSPALRPGTYFLIWIGVPEFLKPWNSREKSP